MKRRFLFIAIETVYFICTGNSCRSQMA
ncbi:hypothetical protein HBR20_08475, partial [Staphylococcus aureus]|nr:hypothetical protein [Staphylococcus aureus]